MYSCGVFFQQVTEHAAECVDFGYDVSRAAYIMEYNLINCIPRVDVYVFFDREDVQLSYEGLENLFLTNWYFTPKICSDVTVTEVNTDTDLPQMKWNGCLKLQLPSITNIFFLCVVF